ncbi:MAG: hypothetical protein ACRDHH_03730 [Actinomycetota bacterium]
MGEPRYFEPATVQYDDWMGTSAFDDAHEPEDELPRVIGLPDGYWVIAFSAYPVGGDEWGVEVYAVDKQRIPNWQTLDELRQAEGGEVPVIEVEANHLDTETFLKCFKRMSLRAMWRPQDFPGGPPRLRIERSLFIDVLREETDPEAGS